MSSILFSLLCASPAAIEPRGPCPPSPLDTAPGRGARRGILSDMTPQWHPSNVDGAPFFQSCHWSPRTRHLHCPLQFIYLGRGFLIVCCTSGKILKGLSLVNRLMVLQVRSFGMGSRSFGTGCPPR
jgi:hypothetical protein